MPAIIQSGARNEQFFQNIRRRMTIAGTGGGSLGQIGNLSLTDSGWVWDEATVGAETFSEAVMGKGVIVDMLGTSGAVGDVVEVAIYGDDILVQVDGTNITEGAPFTAAAGGLADGTVTTANSPIGYMREAAGTTANALKRCRFCGFGLSAWHTVA